jgi:hypothetical protein
MRLRDKNSLPLTPKTVLLLRLPRTIGKRKGDDNKFFSRILAANHQSLTTTLNSHFQVTPLNGLCFFRITQQVFRSRDEAGNGQNQPGCSSSPVPNCLTAPKRGRFDLSVKRGCVQSSSTCLASQPLREGARPSVRFASRGFKVNRGSWRCGIIEGRSGINSALHSLRAWIGPMTSSSSCSSSSSSSKPPGRAVLGRRLPVSGFLTVRSNTSVSRVSSRPINPNSFFISCCNARYTSWGLEPLGSLAMKS